MSARPQLDQTPPPPAGEPIGYQGIRVEIRERRSFQANGFLGLFVAILLGLCAAWAFGRAASDANAGLVAVGVLLAIAAVLVLASLTVIHPGQTSVVQFFGRYVGTVRRTGLVWVLPLTTRRTLSVRVRNFETERLKVNDADGNPVDIAAIVVWQVADTAQAVFAVENVTGFVEMQSEA